MTDFDPFERRLGAALRSDADGSVGPFEAGAVARTAIADAGSGSRGTHRRAASFRPVRRLGRGRDISLLAAAAAVLLVGGALAAGSGILRPTTALPPVTGPSLGPLAVASPDAASPSPSIPPSTSPVPSAALLTWTSASLTEDWPAPVRTEPAGSPILVPILWKSVVQGTCPDCVYTDVSGHLADPAGDTGSDALAWVDITGVSFCGICVDVGFGSPRPIGVDPRRQWFAYGLVVDSDGDGVADWRYGVDNQPVGTPGAYDGPSPYRWWRTDLHTGRTESTLNEAWWEGGGIFWGNHGGQSGDAGLSFGGDVTGGGQQGAVPERFYAWASAIQDGRVVATDYAPDAGWLVPSADVKN